MILSSEVPTPPAPVAVIADGAGVIADEEAIFKDALEV